MNIVGHFGSSRPFDARARLIAVSHFVCRSPATVGKAVWIAEWFCIVVTGVVHGAIVGSIRAFCFVVDTEMHAVVEHPVIFDKPHKLFFQINQTVVVFDSPGDFRIVLFEIRYSPCDVRVFAKYVNVLIRSVITDGSPVTFFIF